MSFVNFPSPPPPTLPNDAFFTAMYEKGQDYIDLGANAVQQITSNIASLDLTGETYNFTAQNPADLTLPTDPTAPAVQDLTALEAETNNKPTTPTLSLATLATNLMISDLVTQIKTGFTNVLATQVTFDTTVETTIYSRAVDRETAAMATSYDNYIANNASVGWETATGQDSAAFAFFESERKGKISDINRDMAIKRSDVNLSILFKQAELNQANAQFALTGLQRLEENLASLRVADDSNKLRVFESEIQIFTDIYQIFQANYLADIQRYQAQGRLNEVQANVLIKQLDSINQNNLNMVNLALEKTKTTGSFEISKNQVLIESLKTTGSVLVQAGAAYLNGINYSQSWTQHLGFNASESLST